MTAPRRVPALAVPVDARSAVTFLGYANRSPLLAITTGRSLLVTLTCPTGWRPGMWSSPASWRAGRWRMRWRSSAGTGAWPRCQPESR